MINLLLVEDEKPILQKMVENVDWRRNGYRVFAALNAREALSIVEEEKIDILVTDIKMPGMTGIELIREVRQLNSLIIPIIVSGYADFTYAQQSIRLNVFDYLLKPFRSFRLLEVVNKACRYRREREEEREELLFLKEEVEKLVEREGEHPFFAQLFFGKKGEDIYHRQAFMLKRDDLFKDLKYGREEDILHHVDVLLEDVERVQEKNESFFILFSNIILLTFKTLKEMDYNLDEFIKGLVFERRPIQEAEIEREDLRDYLKDFLLQANLFIIKRSRQENEDLIQDVKHRVIERLAEGITLNQLSKELAVSTGHLSQLFQQQTGQKFSEFLDGVRADQARELLKTTDKKIYEIAKRVGFSDPYYFSFWFKKQVGISPTTFRENLSLLKK